MATYLITLHGNPPPRLAGEVELDRRTVDAKTDRDLVKAVIDFVCDVKILKDGDTIRIEAQTGEYLAPLAPTRKPAFWAGFFMPACVSALGGCRA